MPHTRPNVFAGPYVDRLDPRRGDAAAVAAALADPSARLVPVWRSRNLLRRAPGPAACLLDAGVHLHHGIDPGQLILLGRFGQHCAFAAEFGGDEAPDLGAEGEYSSTCGLRAARSISTKRACWPTPVRWSPGGAGTGSAAVAAPRCAPNRPVTS